MINDKGELARYHRSLASMWNDDEMVGHVFLTTQTWTLKQPSKRMLMRWSTSTPEIERELIEWIVVWKAPLEGQEPYVDDVESDTAAMLKELNKNIFILRDET